MRLGTLNDLGAEPGMPSVPSLRRLIASRSDFPIVEHGRYGKPFVFDLEAAATFVRENWSDRRHAPRRNKRRFVPATGQPQLALFGDDHAAT